MTTTKPQATTEPTLEPCPFCNGLVAVQEHSDLKGMFRIACRAAACKIWPSTPWFTSVAEVITLWNTRYAPASAAPVVDEKALTRRARQIIDAVIESPVIVEVRTFSQPDEVDKLESRVAALLQKSIPAAATAAPVEQTDPSQPHDWVIIYLTNHPVSGDHDWTGGARCFR